MSDRQALSVRAAYAGDLDLMRRYQNPIYSPSSSNFRGSSLHTSPAPIVDTILAALHGKHQPIVNDGVIALKGMEAHFRGHGYDLESIFRGIESFSKGDFPSSYRHFSEGGLEKDTLYTVNAQELVIHNSRLDAI